MVKKSRVEASSGLKIQGLKHPATQDSKVKGLLWSHTQKRAKRNCEMEFRFKDLNRGDRRSKNIILSSFLSQCVNLSNHFSYIMNLTVVDIIQRSQGAY